MTSDKLRGYDHIYRPLYGDYYLGTGDITAIDWNNFGRCQTD